MKLFLINNKYYIVCYEFYEAEKIYRDKFNDYDDKSIKTIELISTDVYMNGD